MRAPLRLSRSANDQAADRLQRAKRHQVIIGLDGRWPFVLRERKECDRADRGHDVHLLTVQPGAIEGVTVHDITTSFGPKPVRYALSLVKVKRLLKQIEPAELVRAIHAVANGEAYLHPDVMKKVVGRMKAEQSSFVALTPRELEVLEWMASPNTYRQIAKQLSVSEETIRSHAKSILEKMGQPNRSQAVLFAIKQGYIKL